MLRTRRAGVDGCVEPPSGFGHREIRPPDRKGVHFLPYRELRRPTQNGRFCLHPKRVPLSGPPANPGQGRKTPGAGSRDPPFCRRLHSSSGGRHFFRCDLLYSHLRQAWTTDQRDPPSGAAPRAVVHGGAHIERHILDVGPDRSLRAVFQQHLRAHALYQNPPVRTYGRYRSYGGHRHSPEDESRSRTGSRRSCRRKSDDSPVRRSGGKAGAFRLRPPHLRRRGRPTAPRSWKTSRLSAKSPQETKPRPPDRARRSGFSWSWPIPTWSLFS